MTSDVCVSVSKAAMQSESPTGYPPHPLLNQEGDTARRPHLRMYHNETTKGVWNYFGRLFSCDNGLFCKSARNGNFINTFEIVLIFLTY